MKRILLTVLIVSALLLSVGSVLAEKPSPITVDYNQAQFQWRGVSDFGDWTSGYSYLEYATSSDFVLTGNVLHTSWSYSPLVTDLAGESTVYVYDKDSGLWIENEGQVSYMYVPGYGDAPVVNFFRGYLDFGGNTPSTTNFVHGVAYQWAYLFVPEGTTLTGSYTPNAVWDETIGAYLVGFSIYLWDKTPQSYVTSFYPFPEPVPASDYNPRSL